MVNVRIVSNISKMNAREQENQKKNTAKSQETQNHFEQMALCGHSISL